MGVAGTVGGWKTYRLKIEKSAGIRFRALRNFGYLMEQLVGQEDDLDDAKRKRHELMRRYNLKEGDVTLIYTGIGGITG